MTTAGSATSDTRTLALIDDLRSLPAETAWVEFKENNSNPQMIGKLISALANSARMADQHFAYVVWGIADGNHAVAGTSFEPDRAKTNGQPLALWLSQYLNPDIAFRFKSVVYQSKKLILLEIPAATTSPIEFERTAYIRIGSATPRLSDHQDHLRHLWTKLQPYAWETGLALQFLDSATVLDKLDHACYFDLTQQQAPESEAGILEKLAAERLVLADVGGRWNITNLGAILFAKDLANFPSPIARKGIRFVAYDGAIAADTVTHRQDGRKGYATGFQGLIHYIDNLLPRNEYVERALRVERPLYPAIAIRELVANALIHQDMTITGAGPSIALFRDRLEITNPGEPLIAPERFLDLPPRSRNEALASLMRRMRLCEEQGTGIDKVITQAELHQLPPPDFRAEGGAVRAVLFAPRSFADMTQEERVRACYQHAALKFVSGEQMRNATLRTRLGISDGNASQASIIIRQAIEARLIKPADPDHPRVGYVPFWA